MYNFCLAISNLLLVITSGESTEAANSVVDPLYSALNIILPSALGVILLSGTIYAIVLGLQYSRAEDSEKRSAAKKKLVGGIIGFGIVIVLVAVLYAVRAPIVEFIKN